jgi:DNA-binding response OmpR family regulator
MRSKNNKNLSPILILSKASAAIEKALAQQAYPLLIAKDAIEALSLYQSQTVSLVILDDIAICKQLNEATSALILLLCDSENIDEAFEAGATDCYLGSIHPRLLEKRVHKLIQSEVVANHDTELALQESEMRYHNLFATEQIQRQFAEALLDTTAALNKETELEAVLDAILENVSRVLPVECTNIMLLEDDWVSIVRQHGYEEAGLDAPI